MSTTFQIITERVDDIPLLYTLIHQRMDVGTALDALFPRHGNRTGLSVGRTLEMWLTHILSEHIHFMSHVQDWANAHPETLAHLVGQAVGPTDLTDDRLGELTRLLSLDAIWHPLEAQVTENLIRVYRLPRRRVRLDASTVSVDSHAATSELFRRGRSKDHRPDLPQFKFMLGALDPLGLPLAADVVPGNAADDPLYQPTLKRLMDTLGETGLLFIGDSKMSALSTRAYVQERQHFYLMPLAQVGQVPELLTTWVAAALTGSVVLTKLYADDGTTVLGQAYELTREQTRSATPETPTLTWTERVLIVQSERGRTSAQRGLAQRLERAETALRKLTPPRSPGRRQFTAEAPFREAVSAILKQYDVEGLLTVALYQPVEPEAPTQRYAVRLWRNPVAIAAYERTLGWRAYVTNAPAQELSLAEAVQAYWEEWLVEHDIARLKGRPLSLAPAWVSREDHAVGLTRLLTLALRVLVVAEYQVRRELEKQQTELAGLYPGQPQRRTPRPTTERLLKAFGNLTLTILRGEGPSQRHLTPLSALQEEILLLMNCPRDLYDQLLGDPGKGWKFKRKGC